MNNKKIVLDKIAFMTNSGKVTNIGVKNNIDVTWESHDPKIATVDKHGNVTALNKGETFIIAKNNTSAEKCRVTVDFNPQNPVIPPTWGTFIADCEPHVFNDRLYIYGSLDAPDGHMPDGTYKYCTKEYHVIYTDDMVNWTDAGISLTLDVLPQDLTNDGTRLWAPDAFYCPKNKKYYLTCCTNTNRMFILESDVPEGPFVNPKLMTRGGVAINEIDPSVLVDDDGKIYLASPSFFVAQLDPNDYSKVLEETYTDVTKYMPKYDAPFEGPSLKKKGDTYFYIYIQNNGPRTAGFTPTRMVYMTSKNPLGPYEYQGLIAQTHNYLATTNIHGSIVCFKNKWYLVHHIPVAELRRTRTINIENLEFYDNELIKEVTQTSCGIKGAFSIKEKIQASSGVIFSGNRGDVRIKTRKTPSPENEFVVTFTDFPYAFFNKHNEYIGYRYVDFTTQKSTKLEISISTACDNCILEVRQDTPNGELIGYFNLPDTKNEWKTLETEITTKNNVATIYFILKNDPNNGDVKLDWFTFK